MCTATPGHVVQWKRTCSARVHLSATQNPRPAFASCPFPCWAVQTQPRSHGCLWVAGQGQPWWERCQLPHVVSGPSPPLSPQALGSSAKQAAGERASAQPPQTATYGGGAPHSSKSEVSPAKATERTTTGCIQKAPGAQRQGEHDRLGQRAEPVRKSGPCASTSVPHKGPDPCPVPTSEPRPGHSQPRAGDPGSPPPSSCALAFWKALT